MVALTAEAREAVDTIDACTTVVTRVDDTVIDVDIAHFACVTRLTCTLVAIDLVNAPPIFTGLALAVVQVHLTVESRSAFGA